MLGPFAMAAQGLSKQLDSLLRFTGRVSFKPLLSSQYHSSLLKSNCGHLLHRNDMGIICYWKGCYLERKMYIYIFFHLARKLERSFFHNIHYNRYQLQSKSGGTRQILNAV